jgi:hypothetical protein
MFHQFMDLVNQEFVGAKKGANGANTQRIEVTHFLHLAVVGYHETRPEAEGSFNHEANQGPANGNAAGLSKNEQELLFREAEQHFESGAPGGQQGYDSQQQQQQYGEEQQYGEQQQQQQYGEYGEQQQQEQQQQQQEQQYDAYQPQDQTGNYLDTVERDRQAIDGMERDLANGNTEENNQHIQQMVHHLYNATDHYSESYVQELIQNSCEGLLEEVVTEIMAESKQQMETKVEMIIRNISRQPNTPADDEFEQLVSEENAEAMEQTFLILTEPNMDENEALEQVDQLSQAIVQLPELTAEIEQLVSLLTSYAKTRLQGQ